MNFFHKISIDRLNPNYISGWCYNRVNKRNVVNLCLRYRGEVISRTSANIFREDLLELDLHPTGKCGFELIIDPPVARFEKKAYTLTLEHSVRPLAVIDSDLFNREKKEGFREKLGSLVPSFPRPYPLLLFMHIPKTAGTTFNTQVSTLLPRNKIATHIELDDKSRYNALADRKYYLSGHLRFGIFKEYLCHGDFQLYTIVREPYAHLHSHLKWMINTANENSDNYFKHSNKVIYELGRKLADTEFDSAAHLNHFVQNISVVESRFFDNMQTRYFCDQEIDRVSGVDLELATENTSAFKLIGITERYNEFVNKFINLHKLQKIETSRQLNRSKSMPLFDIEDSEMRQVLYPLVQYDLRLYNHIIKEMMSR